MSAELHASPAWPARTQAELRRYAETLAGEAQTAVERLQGCLVAADLAARDPATHRLALAFTQRAQYWLSHLESVVSLILSTYVSMIEKLDHAVARLAEWCAEDAAM